MSDPRRLQASDRSASLPDLKNSLKANEHQNKVADRNITLVEKHFGLITQQFNRYTVKNAKLRDVGDDLSKAIYNYADEETTSQTKEGLTTISECIAAVQDQRNKLVEKLENRVVEGFRLYETKCRQSRQDMKTSSAAWGKEMKMYKSLERVQHRSPQDRSKLARAQTEYQKATDEANRSTRTLREQMDEFERQKMRDTKQLLGEFLYGEMFVCAKSLELFTKAYQQLMNIGEEEELAEFRNLMTWYPPNMSMPGQMGARNQFQSEPCLVYDYDPNQTM